LALKQKGNTLEKLKKPAKSSLPRKGLTINVANDLPTGSTGSEVMSLFNQASRVALAFSTAMFMSAMTGSEAQADRAEPRDLPKRKNVSRSSGSSNGFFNFLDFSNRSSSRFNNYDDLQEIPRAPRAPVDTYTVRYYTYTPDRHFRIQAAGLSLPLPDLSTVASNTPAGSDPLPAAGARKLDDSLAQTIFDTLKSGAAQVHVTKTQRQAIIDVYKERGFKGIWTSMDGFETKALSVLAVLNTAAAEGFDAADYRMPVVDDMGSPGAVETDLSAIARFDIEMTALAVRYAQNASGGTIVPNRLSGYHDLRPPRVSAKVALNKLVASDAPGEYLMSLHPTHPAYAAMRQALAESTQTAEIADQPEPLPFGPTITPGMTDYRVGLIRARLITLGHLDAGDPQGQDATVEPAAQELPVANDTVGTDLEAESDNLYDRQMVRAVKAFQREAGLRPDALIGPATLRAFNGDTPQSIDKAQRLRVNMERLRWLPRHLGNRHIFVNQASYRLQVVDNGRTVWRTKVIVGKPKHQTAFFSDTMETVVFNPYWGVPQSIIVNEMLPKLVNDPGYLDRQGYEVISEGGRRVSSYDVDWWQYYDKVPYGVRQLPGRRNALGEVKFLFPNKHAIYLHDTPTKKLFSRGERAFSHGCVRVENPRELAKAVLGWNDSKVAATINTGRNTKVSLDRKFRVHLTYFTAWPGADGTIDYPRDVYGRDSRIEAALQATKNALN
jgi:murein L,D-transpeptidase YcbB/YkuD